ncbi:MAG: HEAT repeat domain-containing protein [Planctomycetota bacterium]|nr:HEAT repeat domain-containing protein [Planctomycetota bacterium]
MLVKRVLGICLLVAVGTAPARAESGRAYVTEFGRRILGRCDQVVAAKVSSVRLPFRGISTARLDVTERLSGYDPSTSLLLMFIQDYRAPDAFASTLERGTVVYERRRAKLRAEADDPDRLRIKPGEGTGAVLRDREKSSTPRSRGREGLGVRFAKGEEGLFFLRRKGASYQLVGFVPRRDVRYDRKLRRLKEILRIESKSLLELRVEEAKSVFLHGLSSKDVWERSNSARELRGLARRYAEVFVKRDAQRLAQALYREVEPSILAALEGAVRVVDPKLAQLYAEEEEGRARDRWAEQLKAEGERISRTKIADVRAADVVAVANRYGRAATQLLVRYLKDDAAIVRERVAQALAERGGPSSKKPLREALARERDANAALAMVYACGVKADPEAVPILVGRLREARLERPVLHALARIGTPAARVALTRHRRGAPAATVELIDTLLREEFAERS